MHPLRKLVTRKTTSFVSQEFHLILKQSDRLTLLFSFPYYSRKQYPNKNESPMKAISTNTTNSTQSTNSISRVITSPSPLSIDTTNFQLMKGFNIPFKSKDIRSALMRELIQYE